MILTTHESEQRAELRKALRWPTYPNCSGSCQQDRACDCTAAVPDPDEWQATSWRDDLAFWGTVSVGAFAFCTLLALALGWRL